VLLLNTVEYCGPFSQDHASLPWVGSRAPESPGGVSVLQGSLCDGSWGCRCFTNCHSIVCAAGGGDSCSISTVNKRFIKLNFYNPEDIWREFPVTLTPKGGLSKLAAEVLKHDISTGGNFSDNAARINELLSWRFNGSQFAYFAQLEQQQRTGGGIRQLMVRSGQLEGG
jgi:hypothetical protein